MKRKTFKEELNAADVVASFILKEDVQKLAVAFYSTVKTLASTSIPMFMNKAQEVVETQQRRAAAEEDIAEAAQTIAGHLGDIANMMRQRPSSFQEQQKGPVF